jgi:hypothetical protein
MLINILIAGYMCLGLGMPDGKADLMTTNFWYYVYLLPVPLAIVSIFLALFVYKQDSINFHVQNNQKSNAMLMIQALYPSERPSTHE